MCTNDINAGQLSTSIVLIDETIALARRWAHRGVHSAEDAQLLETAISLKEVQALLDEARALLSETGEKLERESVVQQSVTVELL